MFAQLGNLIFENLNSFSDFSQAGSALYAEHALIDGKPILQRTGSSLNEINLSIRFHALFCNPKDQLDSLKAFRNDGEILPLLWGNGNVEGDFVITEINETIENCDPTGTVISYLVNFILKEYVTPDRLQQEQASNIKKATAVGDIKPVAKSKTNPSTCPQIISKIVNSVSNHSAAINKFFTDKSGPQTPADKGATKGHLSVINKLCTDLQQRNSDPKSCVTKYPDVNINATESKKHSDAFASFVDDPNTAILFNLNNNLQASVTKLKASARPLITQNITRKNV